jgi:hypothetical protein
VEARTDLLPQLYAVPVVPSINCGPEIKDAEFEVVNLRNLRPFDMQGGIGSGISKVPTFNVASLFFMTLTLSQPWHS